MYCVVFFILNYNLRLSHFPSPEVTINYRHGLPVITLTLPTRSERCRFTVKPMVTTVGAFLQDVQREDKGIERAEVFATGILHFCHSLKWIYSFSNGLYFCPEAWVQISIRFSIAAVGAALECFGGYWCFRFNIWVLLEQLIKNAELDILL